MLASRREMGGGCTLASYGVYMTRADEVPGEKGVAAAGAGLDDLLSVSSPVNWRLVSSAAAVQRWTALRDWVGWFRGEFGFDHRVVPPCWHEHPALVNVLTALRDHWLAAYDPFGALVGPSDWHRALMQLEVRLRDWASRTGCTATVHRADTMVADVDDLRAWQEHIAADVAARRNWERQPEVHVPGQEALPGIAVVDETQDDGRDC